MRIRKINDYSAENIIFILIYSTVISKMAQREENAAEVLD